MVRNGFRSSTVGLCQYLSEALALGVGFQRLCHLEPLSFFAEKPEHQAFWRYRLSLRETLPAEVPLCQGSESDGLPKPLRVAIGPETDP